MTDQPISGRVGRLKVPYERAAASCERYEPPEPGTEILLLGRPLCGRCKWAESTHHEWQKTRSKGSLGAGWRCDHCGRTAYEAYDPKYADAPPNDYPPCDRFHYDTGGDTD